MGPAAMRMERKRALKDVLSLKAVLSSGSIPNDLRRGLLFEESPNSIKGTGSTISLLARLTNLELALQADYDRIEQLEKRLKSARMKRKKK
jgi:hypothetical protein